MKGLAELAIYLEIGRKRTIAGAVDWPGWCRSGRDEAAAMEALFAYSARYARVLGQTALMFEQPVAITSLHVIERLVGNATTDYGGLGAAPAADTLPVDEIDLERFQTLLGACWRALDEAVQSAQGKELSKGPRGGGRDLNQIVRHLLESDTAYLRLIGRKPRLPDIADLNGLQTYVRQMVLDGLVAAVREGVPLAGPRGGAMWTPRRFVRHVAYHVLDHTWEIEDRIR